MKSTRGALALPLALILFVVFFGALQIGCGSDDEGTTPDPDRVRSERSTSTPDPSASASATPSADAQAGDTARRGGTAAGDSAPLILELQETVEIDGYYPEDAPLYPDVKPSKLTQSPDGKVTIMMGTDAAPGEAVEVMSQAAEAQGWTILSDQVMGGSGSLVIAEKDGRQLRMLVSRLESQTEGEKTLVAVSVDP